MPLKTEPGLILPGQRSERRNAPAAFPVGVFHHAERRVGAVRPGVVLGAVVGGIHDDGVVGDAEFIELVEQFADLLVVSRPSGRCSRPARSCRGSFQRDGS